MTTYTANIPQPSDNPSSSQDQILQNFQTLNTTISVNHVAMNDSDQGKHKFLQLPEQASAPTTAANEGGLYTKAVSGNTELFYRAESDGKEYQMTKAFSASSNGYFDIPGGLRYQWGKSSKLKNGSTVTYPTPFTSGPYIVQTQILQNSSASNQIFVDDSASSTTQFTVRTTAGSLTIYWFAIGTV